MNLAKDIVLVILALAVILLFVKVLKLEQGAEPVAESVSEHPEQEDEPEEEGEIAPYMNKFQVYMDKLWFAGDNENWELADFYAHELEETTEELEEMDAEEEGYKINELLENMYAPAFEDVEAAIDAQDKVAFSENYTTLVNSCNSCHAVVKHQFLKVKVPERPAFSNQDFSR